MPRRVMKRNARLGRWKSADRVHRAWQHGRADGGQPRRGRARRARASTSPPPAPRASPPAASAAEAAAGAEVVDHHAAERRDPARRRGRGDPGDGPGRGCSAIARRSTSKARAPSRRRPRPPGSAALDAPVSGGVGGAAAGTLTFMVGGVRGRLRRVAAAVRRSWARRRCIAAPPANGQAAKICNNMILGVTMIATCEAFALADKLGLDRQAMFDVVSTSSGQSWSMTTYCPAPGIGPNSSPADNGYQPGLRRRADAEGPAPVAAGGRGGRCRHADGRAARPSSTPFVEDEDGRGRDFSAMLPRFEARGRTRMSWTADGPRPGGAGAGGAGAARPASPRWRCRPARCCSARARR